MFEAGLLTGKISEKQVVRAYIDPELGLALEHNGMEQYLAALAGHWISEGVWLAPAHLDTAAAVEHSRKLNRE